MTTTGPRCVLAQLVPILMLPLVLALCQTSGSVAQRIVPSAEAEKNELYAAPDGQGSVCSIANPCALGNLQAKARAIVPGASTIELHLAAGKYLLSAPLLLTPEDSGTNSHPVHWSGPADGVAVLDGGKKIANWKLFDKQHNIWSASLRGDVYAVQIYVNGRRAVRARREGCRKADCAYFPDGMKGTTAFSLARLKHPEEVVAAVAVRWRDFRCQVASVKDDSIIMAAQCWHNTAADSVKNDWSAASPKGKHYEGMDWFENAYEFLGEPGQFYIDRRRKMIFYTPRSGEDLRTADVELPELQELLVVKGTAAKRVHDISFDHITFSHSGWRYPESTDGYVSLQAGYLVTGKRNDLPDNGEGMVRIPAAVEVSAGERIKFCDDHFIALGGAGIAMDGGTKDSVITATRFEDISGGAIFIGDTIAKPSSPEERSARNVVSRNVITHIAEEYRDNVAIMAGFNDGLTIDHNTVSEVPYTGISVGWGWNYEGEGDVQRDIHIRSNRLSHFMLALHDGGAIYTQSQSPGSDIVENYITYKDNDNGNGIYLDERSRKYTVCGNVVWDMPLKMQEGEWVSSWAKWGGDLDIYNNWSDDVHTELHNAGPTKRFHDNHLALKTMPAEAQAVKDASGAAGGKYLVTNCIRGMSKERK